FEDVECAVGRRRHARVVREKIKRDVVPRPTGRSRKGLPHKKTTIIDGAYPARMCCDRYSSGREYCQKRPKHRHHRQVPFPHELTLLIFRNPPRDEGILFIFSSHQAACRRGSFTAALTLRWHRRAARLRRPC